MSRDPFEQPAVPFNPRRSDDPMHRIQMQAENRARRLGCTEEQAVKVGRRAMALWKMMDAAIPPAGPMQTRDRPNSERILRVVVGDFRR